MIGPIQQEGTQEEWKDTKERIFWGRGLVVHTWGEAASAAAEMDAERKAARAEALAGHEEAEANYAAGLQDRKGPVGEGAIKKLQGKVGPGILTGAKAWFERGEPSIKFNDLSIKEQNTKRESYFEKLLTEQGASDKERKVLGKLFEPSNWEGVTLGVAQGLESYAEYVELAATVPMQNVEFLGDIATVIKGLATLVKGKEGTRPPSVGGTFAGHIFVSLPEMFTIMGGTSKLLAPLVKQVVGKAGKRAITKSMAGSVAKGLGRRTAGYAARDAVRAAQEVATAYSRGLVTALGFSAMDLKDFVRGDRDILDLAKSGLIGFVGGYPESAMLKIAGAGVTAGAAATFDEQQAWITGVPFIDAGVTTAAMFGGFHLFGGRKNIKQTAVATRGVARKMLKPMGIKIAPEVVTSSEALRLASHRWLTQLSGQVTVHEFVAKPWQDIISLDPKYTKRVAKEKEAEQLVSVLRGLQKTTLSATQSIEQVDRRFLPLAKELRQQELKIREILQRSERAFEDPAVYAEINKYTEMVQTLEDGILQKRAPIRDFLNWEEITLNEKGIRYLEGTKGATNTHEVLLKLLTRPIRVHPAIMETFQDQIRVINSNKKLNPQGRKTKLDRVAADRQSYLAKQAVGIMDTTYTYDDLQIMNIATEKAPEFMKALEDMGVLDIPSKIKKAPKAYRPGYKRSIHDLASEVQESGLPEATKQKIIDNVQKTFAAYERKPGKTIKLPGTKEQRKVNEEALRVLDSIGTEVKERMTVYWNETLPLDKRVEYLKGAAELVKRIPEDLRLDYVSEDILVEMGFMEPQVTGLGFQEKKENLQNIMYMETGAKTSTVPEQSMKIAKLMMDRKVEGTYDENNGNIVLDAGEFVGGVWKPKERIITLQELKDIPVEGDVFQSEDMRHVVVYNEAGAKTAVVLNKHGEYELYDLTTPQYVRKIAPRRLGVEESKALFYGKTGMKLRVEKPETSGEPSTYSYWHHDQLQILTEMGLQDFIAQKGKSWKEGIAQKDLSGIEVGPDPKFLDPNKTYSDPIESYLWTREVIRRIGLPEGAQKRSFLAETKQMRKKLSLAGIKKVSTAQDRARRVIAEKKVEAAKKAEYNRKLAKIMAEAAETADKAATKKALAKAERRKHPAQRGAVDEAFARLETGTTTAADKKLLRTLVFTDKRSGLSNERAFDKDIDMMKAARAVPVSDRNIGEQRAANKLVAAIDVHGFEKFNVKYKTPEGKTYKGHAAGDKVIEEIGTTLKKFTSYRLHGDEFAVVGTKAELTKAKTTIQIELAKKGIEIDWGVATTPAVADRNMMAAKAAKKAATKKPITKEPKGGTKLGFLGTQALDKQFDAHIATVVTEIGKSMGGLSSETRHGLRRLVPVKTVLDRWQRVTGIAFWDLYNRMEVEALSTIRQAKARMLPDLAKIAKGVRDTTKPEGIREFLQTENITDRAKIVAKHNLRTKDLDLAHRLEKTLREAFGEHWVEYMADYIPHAAVLAKRDKWGKLVLKDDKPIFEGTIPEALLPWMEAGFDPSQTNLFHLANNAIHSKMRRHLKPYVEEMDRLVEVMEEKTKAGVITESTYRHARRDVNHYKARAQSSLRHDSLTTSKAIKELNHILKFLPMSKGREMKGTVENNLVSTYLLLTYAGTMPGRIGLCLRNAIQPIKTTYLYMGARNMRDGYKMAFTTKGRALSEEWGFLGELRETPKGLSKRETPHMTTGVPQEGEAFFPGTGAVRKAYDAGMWAYKWVDSVNRRVSACAAYSAVKRLAPGLERGEISIYEFLRESGITYFDKSVQLDIMRPSAELFNKKSTAAKRVEAIEAIAKRAGRHTAEDSQWIYRPANSASILNTRIGRFLGQFGTWPSNYLQFLRRGLRSGDRVATQRFITRWAMVNAAMGLAGDAIGIDMSRMMWGGPLQYRGGPGISLIDAAYDAIAPYEWKRQQGLRSLGSAAKIMIPGYLAIKDYIIDPLAAEDTADAWKQVFGQRPKEEGW